MKPMSLTDQMLAFGFLQYCGVQGRFELRGG
jgi:hypothetical protein